MQTAWYHELFGRSASLEQSRHTRTLGWWCSSVFVQRLLPCQTNLERSGQSISTMRYRANRLVCLVLAHSHPNRCAPRCWQRGSRALFLSSTSVSMKFVHMLLLGSMSVNVILLIVLQTAVGGAHLRGDSGASASHSAGAHHPAHSLNAPPQRFTTNIEPVARVDQVATPSMPAPTAMKLTPSPRAAAATPDWAKPAAPLSPSATRTLTVQPTNAFVNPLLRHLGGHNADSLWDQLLATHPDPSSAFVVEVGVHDGNQALAAGKMGFQVITYEPSPKSAQGIRRNFAKHGSPRNVKLIEAAATNFTGSILVRRR